MYIHVHVHVYSHVDVSSFDQSRLREPVHYLYSTWHGCAYISINVIIASACRQLISRPLLEAAWSDVWSRGWLCHFSALRFLSVYAKSQFTAHSVRYNDHVQGTSEHVQCMLSQRGAYTARTARPFTTFWWIAFLPLFTCTCTCTYCVTHELPPSMPTETRDRTYLEVAWCRLVRNIGSTAVQTSGHIPVLILLTTSILVVQLIIMMGSRIARLIPDRPVYFGDFDKRSSVTNF